MDLGSEVRFGDRLLRLQLSELRSVIEDRSRHQRVSVAVVDFDMPKMTGVEFCRAIRDLPVKTILLTGKAGLETAIAAFNEGVIDCFLQKQDQSVTDALRREIKRLQDEYFAEISAPINSALALQKPSFFADPSFVELFKEVAEKNGVVEHYVCASPPGVMMRDAEGNEFFLLDFRRRRVKTQCETAESYSAPADMVQLLRTRKAHAWFPTQEGLYHPDYRGQLGALHLAGAGAAGLGRVELQLHPPREPCGRARFAANAPKNKGTGTSPPNVLGGDFC